MTKAQRRRNRRDNGGARPRNAEIAGAKVSFRRRNNFPRFQLVDSLSMSIHLKSLCVVHLHQNSGAKPRTPVWELAAQGEGAAPPPQEPNPD